MDGWTGGQPKAACVDRREKPRGRDPPFLIPSSSSSCSSASPLRPSSSTFERDSEFRGVPPFAPFLSLSGECRDADVARRGGAEVEDDKCLLSKSARATELDEEEEAIAFEPEKDIFLQLASRIA